jgi:threonine aldolase
MPTKGRTARAGGGRSGKGCHVRTVELRSDTKTKPSQAMRQAMFTAEVGDDVSGEDPTVNRLEHVAADIMGKDAALYVSSGTMGNLTALLTHCRRGQEVILGDKTHIFWAEVGGAAALGGLAYHIVPNQPDGTMALPALEEAIRADDLHYAPTGLICLENTNNRMGGAVLSMEYMDAVRALADRHSLPLHLDGARVFNAAEYLGVPVGEVAARFDSVQFCLSKGLGAPVGSVLVGTAEFIGRARKFRKMLGGGMRQAGVIAAAGIVALEEMVPRLREDHANARLLGEGIAGIPGLWIDLDRVQTNIVNFSVVREDLSATRLENLMVEEGVLFHALNQREMRMVTHKDVSREDIEYSLERLARVMAVSLTPAS